MSATTTAFESESQDISPGTSDSYDGSQLDLAERISLRRVPGMSTQVSDISEVEYRDLQLEKVVLVSVWTTGTAQDADNAMRELQLLAQTAGSQVLEGLMQRRSHPDPATFIGRGKVAEVREVVQVSGADTVICDGELEPSQLRNLEDEIGVKVIDRTTLILDIFAQHAKSAEGKAQVELAQLQYLRQRLRGWGGNLSRQVGGRAASGVGIGGRGPGETKIEIDRRRINTRIAVLRRKLRDLEKVRRNTRSGRVRNQVPAVAIVGYTNAGKSSLLNRLTGAGVLVDDALFATLDTTTRRSDTADGRVYTLSDTVGFIRHLPHDLIEAFRSTLEESISADLLLHVVDASDGDPFGQVTAVRAVLAEIGAGDITEQLVMNKIDIAAPEVVATLRARYPQAVFISVRRNIGLDNLRETIAARLPRPTFEIQALVPYARGDIIDQIHKNGELLSSEHTADGTLLKARVNSALANSLAEYQI